jgi:hypothetical protein
LAGEDHHAHDKQSGVFHLETELSGRDYQIVTGVT